MNYSQILLPLVVSSFIFTAGNAFVSPIPMAISSSRAATTTSTTTTRTQQQQQQQQRLNMMMMMMMGVDNLADSIFTSSSTAAAAAPTFHQMNNFLLATIDADIANISDNEFAPIFPGGIMVMFGGILSALIVGFILESNNSYANVIADSYAQSEDDEEFWKGLSDEEAIKVREAMQKLKAAKEGGTSSSTSSKEVAANTMASETVAVVEPPSAATTADNTKKVTAMPSKETQNAGADDMFSDY